MEGISGLSDWHWWDARFPEAFARGQKLLAGDVNAVVDGLFAGGAGAVDVFDQHGSGRPDTEPDLPRELLDRRASQVIMSEIISHDAEREHDYDAVVTVGGHGRAGGGGFAAHTVTSGVEISANGLPLTEVSLIAFQWGEVGVPLIMAAGVDKLQDDLRAFPWVEYVVVKRSKSASEAELLPLEQVHASMRDAARRAVQQVTKARVVTLTRPITISLRATPPGDLSVLKGFPGVVYRSGSVTFTASELDTDGAEALVAMAAIAGYSGHDAVLREVLRARPDGQAILGEAEDLYITRWLDYEAGRWPPISPSR
jgi:D-amino peptidase